MIFEPHCFARRVVSQQQKEKLFLPATVTLFLVLLFCRTSPSPPLQSLLFNPEVPALFKRSDSLCVQLCCSDCGPRRRPPALTCHHHHRHCGWFFSPHKGLVLTREGARRGASRGHCAPTPQSSSHPPLLLCAAGAAVIQ